MINPHRIRIGWLVFICVAVNWGALRSRAFTAADADALFEAHTRAFYQEKNGLAWYKESTEGDKKVSYWIRAEQLEMVLDGYERTKNSRHLAMFTNLFHGSASKII